MERWIPLWERTPDEGEEVAVKVAIPGGTFATDIGTRHFQGWSLQFFKNGNAVAWAPLPKY
jgi:hypothetical protein